MDYVAYSRLLREDGSFVLREDGVSHVLLTNEVTDAAFLHWLRTQKSRVTLLAEAKFGYQASGLPAEGTLRFSDRPYIDEGLPVPVYAGNALQFDGSDDYVYVPNAAELQPLTGNWSVEFWIKRLGAGAGDYPQIIGSRPWSASADKGWAVSVEASSSKIGAHFADGSTGFDVPDASAKSSTATALDTAEHWIVVFDRAGGKLNFYRSGALDVQRSPTYPSGSINQTNHIYIGREIDGGNSRKLNAVLDEIRVYNRIIDATEALEHSAGIYRDDSGLVAAWHFDEGSGSSLADFSGNGNVGTAYNSPTWVAAISNVPTSWTSTSQPYAAVIEGAPTFERSLDVAKLGGRGTASLGAMSLANADGVQDYLLGYILDGRDIEFLMGDPTWERSQFRTIGKGSIASIKADDDTRLTLTLRDKSLLLDATIVGDAMTSGPNEGKPKPVLFGQVYNFDLTPYLYDTTGPSYYFNNYAQDASLAFGNVLLRDGGVSLVNTGFSGTNATITANAGTDTITKTGHGLAANDVIRFSGTDPFAGLAQATQYWVLSSGLTADNFKVSLTRGGSAVDITGTAFTGTLSVSSRRYYIDASAASVTLSSAPTGRVTADILSQGASGDAAIQDVPHAGFRYILDTWTLLTSADRDTDAFALLVAAEQADGTRWGRAVLDRTNVMDLLDEIAVATNSWYSWDRDGLLTVGKLDLQNLDGETPVDTITEDDIVGEPSYENLPLPFGRLVLDANRNTVTQTDGLAGAVTAANRSLWAQPYQTRVTSTDPEGLQYLNDWWTYHKTAIDSAPLETAYVGNAAQDFCDERAALFAPFTAVFSCAVGMDKYALDVGNCVEVTYPRYDLSGGVNFRVAKVKLRPADKLIDLVLVRQRIPNWDALGVGTVVPDAPTIGTATGGNTKAFVAFTAPTNNGGAAITGYTATSTPGGFTGTGTSSPITVTGLSNGTGYTFTVHATNSVGDSAESSASNSVTPAVTVPGKPTGVSAAAASSTSADVTGTAPADNGGSAITGYVATSSPGGLTSTSGALPRTVTGLTTGTDYTFTLHAVNAQGNSAESDPSNTVRPGNRAIALTISANQAAGYDIFAAAGYPADVVDVTVTGVGLPDVYRSTEYTGGYALDTGSGWAAGSTITLTGALYVLGKGGKGGVRNGGAGQNGFPAIYLRWPISIDATNLYIFGGGGGGGGAQGQWVGGSSSQVWYDGGFGGGGAGLGLTGGNPAQDGARLTGGAGEGGYGDSDGGVGGNSATAGADGGNSGGPGGAAGPAITTNGYTVTWIAGYDGPSGTHIKGAVV